MVIAALGRREVSLLRETAVIVQVEENEWQRRRRSSDKAGRGKYLDSSKSRGR